MVVGHFILDTNDLQYIMFLFSCLYFTVQYISYEAMRSLDSVHYFIVI